MHINKSPSTFVNYMRPLISVTSTLVCTLLWLPQALQAATYISTQTVPGGANWNGAYWQLNGAGALVTPPGAGNVYILTNNGTGIGNGTGNTRTRNPAAGGVQTFPGDSLTMYTNTELRAKQ